MHLVLTRDVLQTDPSHCTLGELIIDGVADVKLQTIERPWHPVADAPCGMKFVSCIGVGTYRLRHRFTERKGDHWILSNPDLHVYEQPEQIPGGQYARALVLIHIANWASELAGCIAPGMSRGHDGVGMPMIQQSTAAMNLLRERLRDQADLTLTISGVES